MLGAHGERRTSRPQSRPGTAADANTQSEAVPHASDDDEYVLLVSLPNNAGLAGDRRPRTHRYRSLGLALGSQFRAFREAHELSEAEVAHVLEASRPSISRWEAGGSAPDGLRLDSLRQLLGGKLSTAIRGYVLRGDGLPVAWRDAVRW
jgi:DNA-binding XRE family transcriptional regulator